MENPLFVSHNVSYKYGAIFCIFIEKTHKPYFSTIAEQIYNCFLSRARADEKRDGNRKSTGIISKARQVDVPPPLTS